MIPHNIRQTSGPGNNLFGTLFAEPGRFDRSNTRLWTADGSQKTTIVTQIA
jgi:hypothetical protein